jgi:hypothetical protein
MPAVSKKQQKFFGIVRAVQKGEMAPTTPETAKAAADMKKSDVKKFASTKHKGLPEKKKIKEQVSYIQFTKKAKESSARVAKNKERQREINSMAAYKDKKTKGIKFYDKKGSGRIKAGKKVYD